MNHKDDKSLRDLKKKLDKSLRPCPFCGSKEVKLENTYTPCFWVECSCGAQLTDEIPNRSDADLNQYKESMKEAANKWNTRDL